MLNWTTLDDPCDIRKIAFVFGCLVNNDCVTIGLPPTPTPLRCGSLPFRRADMALRAHLTRFGDAETTAKSTFRRPTSPLRSRNADPNSSLRRPAPKSNNMALAKYQLLATTDRAAERPGLLAGQPWGPRGCSESDSFDPHQASIPYDRI